MKNRSPFFAAILFSLIFGVVSASAQKDYCFENDGLKLKQIVSFTLSGNKIEGAFESGGYDEDASMETFDFTGYENGKSVGGKIYRETAVSIAARNKENRLDARRKNFENSDIRKKLRQRKILDLRGDLREMQGNLNFQNCPRKVKSASNSPKAQHPPV